MTDARSPQVAGVPGGLYFEDLYLGRRMRHSRGLTVGEVENGLLSKQVMNTAQVHWNEHFMRDGLLGSGRLVFGLLTASIIFALSGQDVAEHATAELGCTGLRFLSPVHHGDTLFALTEVVATSGSTERSDSGVVSCKHWGVTHDDRLVFTGQRDLLVGKRSG